MTPRGLPSDAEQFFLFQFSSENHYGIVFLSTPASTIAFELVYALFFRFYAK